MLNKNQICPFHESFRTREVFSIALYMYFTKNVFGVKLYNEKNKKMCIKLSQFENSLHLYLYLVLLGSEKTDLDHEGDKGFENAIPIEQKNTEKLYIIDNFL